MEKSKAAPAKLQSDDALLMIRPMAYVKEADTERYAQVVNFLSFLAICAARKKPATQTNQESDA